MMDEPTAALSAAEVGRLFEIVQNLKRRNTAILYVSHRLAEVFRIADRVTVLRDGKAVDTRPLAELSEDDVVKIEVNGKRASLRSPIMAIHRGIYMLPEDRKVEGIFPDLTVLADVVISARRVDSSTSRFVIRVSDERKQYESIRNSLDIRATSPKQGITKLSGGNQQKVMIGHALVSKSRILLLNEPTRGVDIS